MDRETINVQDLHKGTEFSQRYRDYRPEYPENVFQSIISYHMESAKAEFDFALDVGCGSGQATLPLAKYFTKVVGVDVSEDQIQNVPTNVEGVTFRVAPAEDLSFIQPATVDLVTIATAIHWIDTDKFYYEVERILKPGGTLVVYGYASEHLDDEEAEKYMQQVQVECGQYFTSHGTVNRDEYRDIDLPFKGWTRNDTLTMEKDWTIFQFIGFQSSISFICMYMQDNPERNLLEEMENKLKSIYEKKMSSKANEEPRIKITWPLFMLMGHKPE